MSDISQCAVPIHISCQIADTDRVGHCSSKAGTHEMNDDNNQITAAYSQYIQNKMLSHYLLLVFRPHLIHWVECKKFVLIWNAACLRAFNLYTH